MTARQIWPADACPNMNATPLLTTSCARPEVGLEPQDTLVGDGASLSCFVPMVVLAADARGEECGAAAVFFVSQLYSYNVWGTEYGEHNIIPRLGSANDFV